MTAKEQLAVHLFPKQESQTTCATKAMGEAKQTNEHDDQQGEVGDEGGDICD
jgi:hypothetical protein